MKEIWKDVIGLEGHYQISNKGRIKSLERIFRPETNGVGKIGGIVMRPGKYSGEYLHIVMSKDGVRHDAAIHRLVALHFISNPENKPCVNHIDYNPGNNHVDNLEWCTYKENADHSFNNGRGNWARGERSGVSKLKEFEIHQIFALSRAGYYYGEIAEMFGVFRTTIESIIKRRTWKHVKIN